MKSKFTLRNLLLTLVTACSLSLTSIATFAVPALSSELEEISLAALAQKNVIGENFRVIKKVESNKAYATYNIRYTSGSFTISGLMNVPHGAGPFPAVVIGHGYAEIDVYKSGDGFAKERDFLARSGFLVLHTDYRNHAESDDDPNNVTNLRLDYTEDVIAAVHALRNSTLQRLDKNHIVYFGRSMGGGIGYNLAVAAPNLFDALVIFSPVSADYVDNFNRNGLTRSAIRIPVVNKYGLPEENPEFWTGISPIYLLHTIQDPVLIHHGTADRTCPISWTEEAVALMKQSDQRIVFHIYKSEIHIFKKFWRLSMQRSLNFMKTEIAKASL